MTRRWRTPRRPPPRCSDNPGLEHRSRSRTLYCRRRRRACRSTRREAEGRWQRQPDRCDPDIPPSCSCRSRCSSCTVRALARCSPCRGHRTRSRIARRRRRTRCTSTRLARRSGQRCCLPQAVRRHRRGRPAPPCLPCRPRRPARPRRRSRLSYPRRLPRPHPPLDAAPHSSPFPPSSLPTSRRAAPTARLHATTAPGACSARLQEDGSLHRIPTKKAPPARERLLDSDSTESG
jgi:hypothetical protein